MDLLISGASGMIGQALIAALTQKGHTIRRLVRKKPAPGSRDIFWNPDSEGPDPARLKGIEGVVHLSGKSIASGRWTDASKQAILESRVRSTQLLATALIAMPTPPNVFVGASAIGYYGDQADAWQEETAPSGQGFLAEVCRQWEAAASPIAAHGIRTAHIRIGVVLSRDGGALKTMLIPFQLGVAGRLGGGAQYMSWISLDDLVNAFVFALETPSISGPVNGVAPEPVTNAEFTRTLGRVLHRPTILPVPAAALKLVLGEMANELLLASLRIRPAQLSTHGFRFQYPALEPALRHALEK